MTDPTAREPRPLSAEAEQIKTWREVLYRDAKSAKACGESCAEWEESLRGNVNMQRARDGLSAREVRAIECMVWKIDRRAQ